MSRKIRVSLTQVFVYDPYAVGTSHAEYCDKDPKCSTIEETIEHDASDVENNRLSIEELTMDDPSSTTYKWEVIGG